MEESDPYSSRPSRRCLPLPGTVNPALSLAPIDPRLHGNGWLSIPKIFLRTGCLPPSSGPAPAFPGSAKPPSNSLAPRSPLVRTVFQFIISSRKRHRAGRAVNTQTNRIFSNCLTERIVRCGCCGDCQSRGSISENGSLHTFLASYAFP